MSGCQVFMKASRFLEAIARLFYPPKCIFCGELLDAGYSGDVYACHECLQRIEFYPPGREAALRVIGETAARGCDAVVCACKYNGILKYSIVKYKFYGKSHYYKTYAAMIKESMDHFPRAAEADMLVAVPLSAERLKERGYNQAYLISKKLSAMTGTPDRSYLLKRTRHADNQSHISGNMRHTNIRGSYSVTIPEEIKGRKILLIDDVVTTGSTVSECGRVLKEAGAAYVMAVAIASGRR